MPDDVKDFKAELSGNAFRITPSFDNPVPGEYRLYVIATDGAGNRAEVGPYIFSGQITQLQAVDDGYTTDTRSVLEVPAPGMLGNDLDPDGVDALTVIAVDDGGLVGDLVWRPDGSFTYDPAGQFEALEAGEVPTDSFSYNVSDDRGGVDQATVTIAVTAGAGNRPPVAIGQLVTALQGIPVAFTLTAFDPDRDPLDYRIVTWPSHGALTGTAPDLRYWPEFGYAGRDSFAFEASDGQLDSGVAGVSLIAGVPDWRSQVCTGPNLVRNGDFEQGFTRWGVGIGWALFHSETGAVYHFGDDSWGPVVYDGEHSQLLGISTREIIAGADRYAGIYQTITGLEPGAVYELSLAGMMRVEALYPREDPYRLQVQWAYGPQGGGGWTEVAGWQNLLWRTLTLHADPGAFERYTARFVAPSQPVTLYIRVWKKWATLERELTVNLDGIAVRRCRPVEE
jgi:VCBS repeat-containing protein